MKFTSFETRLVRPNGVVSYQPKSNGNTPLVKDSALRLYWILSLVFLFDFLIYILVLWKQATRKKFDLLVASRKSGFSHFMPFWLFRPYGAL